LRERKLAVQQPASDILDPLPIKYRGERQQPREQVVLEGVREGKYQQYVVVEEIERGTATISE
jgi:hypothetical protein